VSRNVWDDPLARVLERESARWAQAERGHVAKQVEVATRVDALRAAYSRHERAAVEQHAEMVLNASEYPDWISVDFGLGYNPDNRILVVDYGLPGKDVIPTLRQVTYVASRDEMRESYVTDAQSDRTYDSVCYQIALRTLHELFEADDEEALAAVVFNGWVEATNRATGRLENACILSVHADRSRFFEIDLSKVDPKACFRQLRGVSAAKLAGLTPVQPVMQLDREDPRFIDGRSVGQQLDPATNLAAMPWEDFEHLVREVFEQEFAAGGGEVKVTRASRDHGVDAVAFDPDPIRGGKIVIQAKRYTATVGVSAVRDLYGTVLNEGAMKGILVTTADYGPDAHDFAKDKPLTLLSGSNLLAMMERHGHKVRIDLAEARRVNRDAT
jgi:restriction system protein